jgi:hypothetical protein
VIDGKGQRVGDEEFDHIGVFVEDWVLVTKDGQSGYIDSKGQHSPYRMNPVDGFTELSEVYAAFATAMKSKSEEEITAFARKIVPDSATVDFLSKSGFDYRTLLYDLKKNACTLESLRESYAKSLIRFKRDLASEGLLDNLSYADTENRWDIRSEAFCVVGMVSPVQFTAGTRTVSIQFGDLERMDGRWKIFQYPTMDVE